VNLDDTCPTCGAAPGQLCRDTISCRARGTRARHKGDPTWRYRATCCCCGAKTFRSKGTSRLVVLVDEVRKRFVCLRCQEGCLPSQRTGSDQKPSRQGLVPCLAAS